ncbi:MAG: hypothetical protein HRU35_05520 [Rickettsiaceae bacterium]|nr:hypothetical protein [Rickettsiaceae bacterium]
MKTEGLRIGVKRLEEMVFSYDEIAKEQQRQTYEDLSKEANNYLRRYEFNWE